MTYKYSHCHQLKEIIIQSNPRYSSVDGVLYSKDMKTLILMPGGKDGSYVVDSETENIGNRAFGLSKLHNVRIGENIKTIGEYAFCHARIKEIHIRHEHPENLTIGQNAFDDLEDCILYVPIGTGYAYRHHPAFMGKFKEVKIEK